jgi:hypothetical protein
MTTAGDMISNSLMEIGALAQGETAAASDLAFGLSKLNRMLDLWNTRSLFVYCITNTSFPFSASQQSYTIGPAATSADFTATRPVRIDRANLVLVSSTPHVQTPLWVMNVDDYSSLRIPALSSTFPTRLYYQATYPKGTLWPWPYPTDVTNELELYMWTALSEFATTASTVSLPPGYEEALTLTLAESMCPAYGKQIDPGLARFASQARANVQALNSGALPLRSDVPQMSGGQAGFFNYRTGGLR